jgi:hypothetical protein
MARSSQTVSCDDTSGAIQILFFRILGFTKVTAATAMLGRARSHFTFVIFCALLS